MLNDLLEDYKAITLNSYFNPGDELRDRRVKLTAITQYIDNNSQWMSELADVCDSRNAGIAFYEIAQSRLKGERSYTYSLISYYFFTNITKSNWLNQQASEACHYRGLLLFNLVLTNESIVHRLFNLSKAHINILSMEGRQEFENLPINDDLQILDFLLISDILYCGNEYDYDSDFAVLKRRALRNRLKYECSDSEIMMKGLMLHQVLYDVVCNSLRIN